MPKISSGGRFPIAAPIVKSAGASATEPPKTKSAADLSGLQLKVLQWFQAGGELNKVTSEAAYKREFGYEKAEVAGAIAQLLDGGLLGGDKKLPFIAKAGGELLKGAKA